MSGRPLAVVGLNVMVLLPAFTTVRAKSAPYLLFDESCDDLSIAPYSSTTIAYPLTTNLLTHQSAPRAVAYRTKTGARSRIPTD